MAINRNGSTYNVVIRHLKEHLDKGGSWDCYAFYVAIKMDFKSSVFLDPTVEHVREYLGVGKTKAGRILSEAASSGLFRHDHKGSLVAVSPKSRIWKNSSRGVPYRSDIIFSDNKSYESFRSLVDELKRMTLCYFIGYVGNDTFTLAKKRTKDIKNECACERRVIKQGAMGKFLHVSRAEVKKLIASLEASGDVVVNEGKRRKRTLVMVCRNYAKEPGFVREFRERDLHTKLILGSPRYKTVWVGMANSYNLTTKQTERFMHKIYNYTRRSSFFRKNASALPFKESADGSCPF